MSNKIYPCLWFNNQAKDAADFYCGIFNKAKVTSSNPIVTEFNFYSFATVVNISDAFQLLRNIHRHELQYSNTLTL